MITFVADKDRIDCRQCRATAERRSSRTPMAASYPRLCHAGTPRPVQTHVRYTVTAPRPASGTLVISNLRGTTWTLTADAGSADLFEVTAGGARLAAAARVAATDSVLTFTTWRGERKHDLLMRAGGNPEAADRARSSGAAVPPSGRWLIRVEAVPVCDGSPLPLHCPRCQPVEYASAAVGVPRGNGGPGQAANTPPSHGQPGAGS